MEAFPLVGMERQERSMKLTFFTDDMRRAWTFVMTYQDAFDPSPQVVIQPAQDAVSGEMRYGVSMTGLMRDQVIENEPGLRLGDLESPEAWTGEQSSGVTDEMVEAALEAWFQRTFDGVTPTARQVAKEKTAPRMRATLEAVEASRLRAVQSES
jgi:hypothetical protein